MSHFQKIDLNKGLYRGLYSLTSKAQLVKEKGMSLYDEHQHKSYGQHG